MAVLYSDGKHLCGQWRFLLKPGLCCWSIFHRIVAAATFVPLAPVFPVLGICSCREMISGTRDPRPYQVLK